MAANNNVGNAKLRQDDDGEYDADDDDSIETDDMYPEVPDGGWGWMVVFASFIIHVIADGIVYSFGVFYMEFLDYFGGGKGETAWIGSLVPGITLCTGPIASALTNKYGCRRVTIIGAFTSSAGFLLSLFAENIVTLYFTFGIMAGFGFGLIYLPAIVCVTQHFEKRRSFATGLAVCGSGFGTFTFAPLSNWLLQLYGWKGAILIEAGLILNCVLCGALFRPLEAAKPKHSRNKISKNNSINSEDEDGDNVTTPLANGDIPKPPSNAAVRMLLEERRVPGGVSAFLSDNERQCALIRSDGALHLVGKTPYSSSKNQPRIPSPLAIEAPAVIARSSHELNLHPSHPYHHQHHHPRHRHNTLGSEIPPIPYGSSTALSQHPMYRKDVFYSASLQNIPMYRSNPVLYITSITSIPDTFDNDSKWKICKCLSPEMRDTFSEMLDVSLLKNPVFLIFAVSNLFTSIGFNMPFIYLPDRARDLGIDKDSAAFLVSIIGISNTVGRILFGWLSDRKRVNRLALYSTALVICGISTALSPLCVVYSLLSVYAAVFGMFIGVYVSLTSVVLVDLLGIDKLTNSFGLLLLFQGMATLIGPPIAGWIYDGTGSYDISFIVEGIVVAISGLMLYFLPCVQRVVERKSEVEKKDIDLDKQANGHGASKVRLRSMTRR